MIEEDIVVNKEKFVNHFDLSPKIVQAMGLCPTWHTTQKLKEFKLGDEVANDSFHYIERVFCQSEIDILITELTNHKWLAVGNDGFANKPFDQVGNYRLSNYNPELADRIWMRIGHIFTEREMDAFSQTDHDNHDTWRPIGISPLFRFIKYDQDGELIAHYDAPFIQSSTRRSLMSLVIYLTDNESGGTRFIKDPQRMIPVYQRDLSDWDRVARPSEVLATVWPFAGSAIAFDHRMLHDSEPLKSGEKIIIRTDIMFERN